MQIVALDQGENHTGWSVFEHGHLRQCGVSKLPPESAIWELPRICRFHFENLPSGLTPGLCVAEKHWLTKAREPTLPQAISKGTTLLQLQAIAFYIMGRLGGEVRLYAPWQCGKKVTQNRVEHLLSPEERKIYDAVKIKKRDDLADSVAFGLRAAGRL